MSLTVALAHSRFSPERRELLPRVLESWSGAVDVVVCDDDRRGSWATVRDCWREAAELAGSSGHVLVAQDDMVMAAGGAELIRGLCGRLPDRVLSFRWPACSEDRLHARTVDTGACWARTLYSWSGGCVAVPARLVPDFLEWAEEFDALLTRDWPHSDDQRLDLFLMSRGIEVWRCRWSLLHHLDGPSVVRGGPRPPSAELGLVDDVASLPGLDDPRWCPAEAAVPSCLTVPHRYRYNVGVLLGDQAGRVGLGHVG